MFLPIGIRCQGGGRSAKHGHFPATVLFHSIMERGEGDFNWITLKLLSGGPDRSVQWVRGTFTQPLVFENLPIFLLLSADWGLWRPTPDVVVEDPLVGEPRSTEVCFEVLTLLDRECCSSNHVWVSSIDHSRTVPFNAVAEPPPAVVVLLTAAGKNVEVVLRCTKSLFLVPIIAKQRL